MLYSPDNIRCLNNLVVGNQVEYYWGPKKVIADVVYTGPIEKYNPGISGLKIIVIGSMNGAYSPHLGLQEPDSMRSVYRIPVPRTAHKSVRVIDTCAPRIVRIIKKQ